MPLLLRTIRRSRWRKDEPRDWLAENEVPADAVTDLQTSENALSVYLIGDDKSDLGVTLAAYAATRDHLSNVDYALVDERDVVSLGVRIEQTVGRTPDPEANRRHRDLVMLSGSRLLDLAKLIYYRADVRRTLAKEVGKLIRHAVSEKRFPADRLKEDVMEKVPPPETPPSSSTSA